jgi:hypothetical protein
MPLDEGFPIFIDPNSHSPRVWPNPNELSDEPILRKYEGKVPGGLNMNLDRRHFI